MSLVYEETDEELLKRYQDGETQVADVLLDRYKNLVRKKANTLFLFGGDTDDLIQEGMIGLFKAIQNYEGGKGTFLQFAQMCMNHQMYDAIEAATRKKHGPLNSYVSFPDADGGNGTPQNLEGEWTSAGEWSASDTTDPAEILIDRESVEMTLEEIRSSLSKMELSVLTDYLDGLNYRQIAEKMEKSPKVIDNALQRIRAKVQKVVLADREG